MPVKPGSEHANDSYLPTSVSSVRLKHEGPHHMYMYVYRRKRPLPTSVSSVRLPRTEHVLFGGFVY